MPIGAESNTQPFAERNAAWLWRFGCVALGAILSSWAAWSGLMQQSSVTGSVTAPIAPIYAFLVDLGVAIGGVALVATWPARRIGGYVIAFGLGGCLSMVAFVAWLYRSLGYPE